MDMLLRARRIQRGPCAMQGLSRDNAVCASAPVAIHDIHRTSSIFPKIIRLGPTHTDLPQRCSGDVAAAAAGNLPHASPGM